MDNFKLALLSLIVAFVFVWIITPLILPVLHRLHFGQAIREEGPKSHMKKSGTPTMGGLVIQGGVLVAALLVGLVNQAVSLFPLIVMVVFGAIGFWDDFIKVTKKHNLGLRAWQKLVLQFGAALIIALYAANSEGIGTELMIPFIGLVDFGFWYVPFTFFAVVAVTNAVNLTDGLDGLASGVTAIVMLFFTVVAVWIGEAGLAIFGGAVMGACLGFLRHNSNPADIFMGDTGSMALGGAVIAIAIAAQVQVYVLIAGLIYVVEALSVCIQVGYFKLTHGKRFFKMAPIHHHFELKGWSETRVVTVFWLVTALCVALAFICC